MIIDDVTKLLVGGIRPEPGLDRSAACECDQTKADKYPISWVACIGNKAPLMRYFGDSAIPFWQFFRFQPAGLDWLASQLATLQESQLPCILQALLLVPLHLPARTWLGLLSKRPTSRSACATFHSHRSCRRRQRLRLRLDLP